MAKAVTFGEIMLRLTPYDNLRFVQADGFKAIFGGSEANVAVSLANYGVDVDYVTKLPKHEIGQMAVNFLRRYGVGTGRIVRGGDRLGVYYLEKRASQRGSVCIYDRARSAIAEAVPKDFDWDSIFSGVDWFHFSGITPALSKALVDICEQACIAAKKRGIKISCDLNYRSQLWSKQAAREAMSRLCGYVDVCIANEEEARDVFDIVPAAGALKPDGIDLDAYISISQQLAERFGFEKVAVILRDMISPTEHDWRCMLYNSQTGENSVSKKYRLQIIDNTGAGDSFCGAFIYALLDGRNDREAIEFASAASALKYSIEGDVNLVSVAEAERLMKS